jgi:drug/metabolite transporter (DMT)-like permease
MTLNYHQLSPKRNFWLLYSLLAMIFFGLGGFSLGLHTQSPILSKFQVSSGYFTAGLLCLTYSLLFEGHFPDLKYEAGLLTSVLTGTLNHLGNFSLILGYHFDPENTGIISIMVIGASIMSSVLAYFIFNEKLAVFDVLGMVLCASGLVLIGIYSKINSFESFLGFGFGLAALVFYAIRSLTTRKAQRQGIALMKSAIFSVFSEALAGFLNVGILCMFFDVFQGTGQGWTSLVGGIFIGIGSFFVIFAIMTGKIGPALLITNCSGILQMVLEYFFRGIVPVRGKLVGAAVTILGVSILMLWKDVVGRVKG